MEKNLQTQTLKGLVENKYSEGDINYLENTPSLLTKVNDFHLGQDLMENKQGTNMVISIVKGPYEHCGWGALDSMLLATSWRSMWWNTNANGQGSRHLGIYGNESIGQQLLQEGRKLNNNFLYHDLFMKEDQIVVAKLLPGVKKVLKFHTNASNHDHKEGMSRLPMVLV